MNTVFIVYVIVLGLFIGSFLNVVGIRVPKGESIIKPPSHCDSCGRRLTPLELVPVFSWLFLRGRCRTCHAKVSTLYPVIEGLVAIGFMGSWLQWGFSWEMAVDLIAISTLAALTVADLLYFRLPDRILLPAMIVLLLLRFVTHPLGIVSYLAGMLLGFVLLFLIHLISRGGMGMGDVKLFAFVGLLTGTLGVVMTLVLASFFGTLVGIPLRIMGKVKAKQPIPFGPFIAMSAVLIHLYGQGLWQLYWGFVTR